MTIGTVTGSALLDQLGQEIIKVGGLKLRDVDGGEEPFLYSSGNKGPGYVNIKGLVSHGRLFSALVANLAAKVAVNAPDIDFVAANVTGGVPPGVLLTHDLSRLFGRELPMVYVRDTRKKGGLREHVTGLDNDAIVTGMRALVVEELVNFATTTTNSAMLLRELGFRADEAACIVSYDTVPCRAALVDSFVRSTHLLTVDQLLEIGVRCGRLRGRPVASYREFLADPPAWMAKRGLVRDEAGGTK